MLVATDPTDDITCSTAQTANLWSLIPTPTSTNFPAHEPHKVYVHMRALTNYTPPPTGEWGSSRENKTSNPRHMTRMSPLPKRSPPQRVGQAVARNLDAWNPIPAMTNVRPDPLLLGPQQV